MKLKSLINPLTIMFRGTKDLWVEADISIANGNWSHANTIYRHLSKRKPQDAEGYQYRALAEHRLGRSKAAASMLEIGVSKYSDAEYLFEHYLRIACELGEIERVIQYVDPNPLARAETCEKLFSMKFADAYIRVSLIEFCLENNLFELAERYSNFVQENYDDPATLWRLADVLIAHGPKGVGDPIYRRLSKREPQDAQGYYYQALSEHRLGHSEAAASILEIGISKYPEAEYLFEYYLHVACELGEIERIVQYVDPDATNRPQICEKLFNMKFAGSYIRVSLIEYCLKNNLRESAEQYSKFVQENYDDPAALWRLADILVTYGLKSTGDSIYRRLSRRRPEQRDDFFYSALAEHRLDNLDRCFELLELGFEKHPGAMNIYDVYIQLCVTYLDFDRYQRFIRKSGLLREDTPQTKLEFYRSTIKSGFHYSFLLHFKTMESECDAASFATLKEEFLSFLNKNPPSLEAAKLMLFFSRYLDVDADYVFRIFEILENSTSGEYKSINKDRYLLRLLYELTPPMIPHYEAESASTALNFTTACQKLLSTALELSEPVSDMTNNWTPWQYIFCLGVPELYHEATAAFEKIAFKTWPKLNYVAPHVDNSPRSSKENKRKIRVGFTVHDSMPMMSGLMSRLDKNKFETVYLRPGAAGNSHTAKSWVDRAGKTVEYADLHSYSAIETIASEELDIIISGPCSAAIFYPLMARLAPLQMVLLEPNWTDGLTNADYYISWQLAEPKTPKAFYKSAVSFLQHPPYWIERPLLNADSPISEEARNEVRQRLMGLGPKNRIYLCANTPPKIHPAMDETFLELLRRDDNGTLVFLRGDYPPSRGLKLRLRQKLGKYYERVLFLPTLGKEDAHMLLQSVDCCLDSHPLCGMSSSFDAAMLGVPIVTLPAEIPFGRWTAAIYEYIGIYDLTAANRQEYVEIALRLAADKDWRELKSLELKEKSSSYVESNSSFDEFQDFLIQAWERKVSGLPTANWLSGQWQ